MSDPEHTPVLADAARPARLSSDLAALRARSAGQSLTVDELEKALKGRGFAMLLLLLPIPFTNMIPAWAVVLLSAGMMERDGLLGLLGHLMTLVSWAFIGLCWLLGVKGIDKLLELFQP